MNETMSPVTNGPEVFFKQAEDPTMPETKRVLTRPDVMRNDLGPILNHLGSEIFASLPVPKAGLGIIRVDRFPLQKLGWFIRQNYFAAAIKEHISEPIKDLLESVMLQSVWNPELDEGRVTYAKKPRDLLVEGLSSGMVMPMQVYIRAKSEQLGYKVNPFGKAEYAEMASVLRDRRFHATLLYVANLKNGVLRTESTHFSDLGISPFARIMNYREDKVFQPGSFKLTETTKENMAKLRDPEISIGCPVRSAVYPELGSFALQYAELKGIPPDELRVQKQSAIVAGSLYDARCIETLAGDVHD